MKKSKIVIAVFVVITAAVSFVKAEELSVDFDRESFKSTDFMQAIKPFTSVSSPQITSTFGDTASARKIAEYYLPLQEKLRGIIVTYCNAHGEFFSNIARLVEDKKTQILYDRENIYVLSGKTLVIINDSQLIREVETYLSPHNKFWQHAAWGAVWGCVYSSECREEVANYINGLHDDEHDAYHNHQDGTNPNYEVYKKVK